MGIKHQSQIANPVGMDDVTGASGLLWVVAHYRTVLVTVKYFDGRIAIQYPANLGSLGN